MAGRKPWEPTEKDRKQIRALIGMGLTARQVAVIIGVSHETLYKYCKEDIDAGRPNALAQVAATAFRLATSGKCPAMTMFWLKTQAGWSQNGPAGDGDEDEENNDPINDMLGNVAKEVWNEHGDKQEESPT